VKCSCIQIGATGEPDLVHLKANPFWHTDPLFAGLHGLPAFVPQQCDDLGRGNKRVAGGNAGPGMFGKDGRCAPAKIFGREGKRIGTMTRAAPASRAWHITAAADNSGQDRNFGLKLGPKVRQLSDRDAVAPQLWIERWNKRWRRRRSTTLTGETQCYGARQVRALYGKGSEPLMDESYSSSVDTLSVGTLN
jgi:hypothetical protein